MKTKYFIQQDWVKKEIISRLNYNPDTGLLIWADRDCPYFNKKMAGKEVGRSFVKGGYTNKTLALQIGGKRFNTTVGRICWLVHTGDWPKHTIDHIDRNPLNNMWENLRDITLEDNNRNKGFYKGRVFKYVYFIRGFWQVVFEGILFHKDICLGKALKKRDELLKDHFEKDK